MNLGPLYGELGVLATGDYLLISLAYPVCQGGGTMFGIVYWYLRCARRGKVSVPVAADSDHHLLFAFQSLPGGVSPPREGWTHTLC